jgi:hypothetical protein
MIKLVNSTTSSDSDKETEAPGMANRPQQQEAKTAPIYPHQPLDNEQQ